MNLPIWPPGVIGAYVALGVLPGADVGIPPATTKRLVPRMAGAKLKRPTSRLPDWAKSPTLPSWAIAACWIESRIAPLELHPPLVVMFAPHPP